MITSRKSFKITLNLLNVVNKNQAKNRFFFVEKKKKNQLFNHYLRLILKVPLTLRASITLFYIEKFNFYGPSIHDLVRCCEKILQN